MVLYVPEYLLNNFMEEKLELETNKIQCKKCENLKILSFFMRVCKFSYDGFDIDEFHECDEFKKLK